MTNIKLHIRHLTIFLMLFFTVANSAFAENMKKLGSMNVHYIAIGSTFLTPTIAKTYNIERSRYNGIVNISVLDNSKKNTPAKKVLISGTARNNLGQEKQLDFNEIKEGDAIYYIAQLNYSNEETFHFTIKLDDGNGQQTLKFTQKFYVD